MTITPPPIVPITVYRVKWAITGGQVIETKIEEDDEGNENETPIEFPTEGYFEDITFGKDDIDFATEGGFIKQLKDCRIIAEIQAGQENESETGDPTYNWQRITTELVSLTIESSHETNETTWKTDNPELYGGVKLDATPAGTISVPGSEFECGPVKSGEYTYGGDTRISGYDYFKCFPNIELSYIKRNSISLGYDDNSEIKLDVGETFPLTPKHPDIEQKLVCPKDPFGKDAPILPMDAITKFIPDDRPSYTVTYTATISVKDPETGQIIPLGEPGNAKNTAKITVTQNVEQDLEKIDFGAQLRALLSFCNFSYPTVYDVDTEDLSEGYSANYPHTTVTYRKGQLRENYDIDINKTPTERTDGTPLEKGDVWYEPNDDVRQYYQINSFVEDVKILESGTIYAAPERPGDFGDSLKEDETLMKGLDNLLGDSQEAINTYLENSNADQVKELLDDNESFTFSYEQAVNTDVTKERYNITTIAENTNSTGYGLTVDIVVNKKGNVIRATVNKPGMYYTDGEIVLLEGGDCKLQVQVNDDEFWTEEFVSRYERPPNFWNNDISNQS